MVQIGREEGDEWQGMAYGFPYCCTLYDRAEQTR